MDLKLSPLELSRWRKLPYSRFSKPRYAIQPHMYLAEMTNKWSIFEKPYLDDDSPKAMNFHFNPNWPALPDIKPGDFPDGPIAIFRFDPGFCWTPSSQELECGGYDSIKAGVFLIPPGESSFEFKAVSQNTDAVRVGKIVASSDGRSAEIYVQSDGKFSGTVNVCIEALLHGRILNEFSVKNPFGEGPGILPWQAAIRLPSAFQLSTTYRREYTYDCGCVSLEIECCNDTEMSWTAGVVQINPDSSVLVNITDTAYGAPYTWSVSGTGFSFSQPVTNATSNYLEADSNACGTAVITVTGCGGNSITGYAMSSAGQWSNAFTISGPSAGWNNDCGDCCMPGAGCGTTSSSAFYKYFNDANRILYPGAADWCYGMDYCKEDPEDCPDSTSCEDLTMYTGVFSNSTNKEVNLDQILRLHYACSSGTGNYGCWEKDFVGQEWICEP